MDRPPENGILVCSVSHALPLPSLRHFSSLIPASTRNQNLHPGPARAVHKARAPLSTIAGLEKQESNLLGLQQQYPAYSARTNFLG